MLMFSSATSKFVELFSSSQMSRHTRCTWELKKIGLLNVLLLPLKTRFHQAAAAAKLALPLPTLSPRHCRHAADIAFVSIVIVVAVIVTVSVIVAVAAFC